MDKIRSKIERNSFDPPLSRLEEEVAFWEEQVKVFHECADKLVAMKKEQDDVIKQEQIYSNLK